MANNYISKIRYIPRSDRDAERLAKARLMLFIWVTLFGVGAFGFGSSARLKRRAVEGEGF